MCGLRLCDVCGARLCDVCVCVRGVCVHVGGVRATGLYVMTEYSLLARGTCCGNKVGESDGAWRIAVRDWRLMSRTRLPAGMADPL
jgi:hypothetical protein